MTAEALHEAVLGAIRGFPARRLSEEDFNGLALRSFRHQRTRNPAYAAFCEARGAQDPADWREIPALPVSAFKTAVVAAFDKKRAAKTFLTSGTTRGDGPCLPAGRRGRHYFESVELYDAAIRALFRAYLLPDAERIGIASLIPPVRDLPESSLSYMAGIAAEAFGDGAFFQAVEGSRSRFENLIEFLRGRAAAGRPALILSTTLALGSFLGFLRDKEVFLELPPRSRIMETGGAKGRRVTVDRAELVRLAGVHLGIAAACVVNEYGMTELTTHFYDRSIENGGGAATDVKAVPPWARVCATDPATGASARPGRTGLLRIIDLANQGSCIAIQTEDEGVVTEEGFQILGRREGADLRGCSLTFEELERILA